MERVLTGRTDVGGTPAQPAQARAPQQEGRHRPRVALDSEASSTATLIEIVAEDRPGLLYDLATAISSNGGNIEVVLIDTQAHKAIDVFYVTAHGGKLTPEDQAHIQSAVQSAVA